MLADVLHHEWDEDILLGECARVCRMGVIVKDHKLEGWMAIGRVSVLDWLANIGYGIECLYRYRTRNGWHRLFKRCGLSVEREELSIRLYPFGLNWIFGNKLQYFAVTRRLKPAGGGK